MSSIEDRCLVALKEAWLQGVESTRSPRKLNIIHGWIRDELLNNLPGYQIYGKTTDDDALSHEKIVEGKYYDKRVDLVVSRAGCDLGVISVKLIQSSYKKNAINCFEHQLGETANLRGQRLLYGNIIFMPHPIPTKTTGHFIEKTETIVDASLSRYRKLVADHDNIVVPDVQAIVIACLDTSSYRLSGMATRTDLSHLSERSLNFLFKHVHIAKFIRDYTNQIKVNYQKLVR